MRLQTVKLVLKGEKSATKIAKDIGVNPNTICRWVQEYRKQNNLYSGEICSSCIILCKLHVNNCRAFYTAIVNRVSGDINI